MYMLLYGGNSHKFQEEQAARSQQNAGRREHGSGVPGPHLLGVGAVGVLFVRNSVYSDVLAQSAVGLSPTLPVVYHPW